MHLRAAFLLDAFISKALSLYKPRQGVSPSSDKVTHVEAIARVMSLSSNPPTRGRASAYPSVGAKVLIAGEWGNGKTRARRSGGPGSPVPGASSRLASSLARELGYFFWMWQKVSLSWK